MHTSSTTQLRMEGKVHDDDDYDYDYNNDVVGAATMNSDDILLLRRIEDDSIGVGGPGGAAGSVSTADLLDMLDREVSANHNHSQNHNRNHSGGGSKGRVRARNDGGYSSGDTTRSSFTSRLLGGQTDDDLVGVGVDIGVGVVPAAGRASSNDNDVVFGADDASETRPLTKKINDSSHSLQGSIDGSVSSSSLYHKYKSGSDASASKSAADGRRLSRQSFDNPFRSRARIGGGSFSDQSRDDGSTSAASASSLGKLLDSGGGGRRPRGQNSVTFSIQEGSRGENSTQSSDVVQPSPGSIDGAGHHPVSVSTRSSRQSSKSSRSSRSSHGSATTASTHSSGDSLQERRRRRELVPVKDRPSSDHRHRRARKSPAAAAATDGLSKWQPRRNRKRGSTGAGDGVGESSRIPYGNRRAAGGGGGGGSDNDDDDVDDDDDGGDAGEEEDQAGAYHGKNLHDHHPVRYPKRSSYCDNGGGGSNRSNEDENEEEDDIVVPLARRRVGGPGDDDASNDEDDDGLFRRVGRVRDGDGGGGRKDGDFLDGLIASTTAARGGGGGRLGSFDDGDDAVSVGETSFLSELLASNNAARHRGGLRRSVAESVASVNTSGQSIGATTLTSHTDNSSEKMDFVNIYSVNANNKQQKRRQRSHYSQWRVNTATIRQHFDRVATKMRQSRAFRRMEQCFNEGGDALPQSVRQSHAFRRMERCYNEGGEVLPRNRKEIAMLLVCGLLLWPLVHVAIIIVTGGGDAGGGRNGIVGRNGGGYFGGEIQFVDSSGRKKQLGGRLGSRKRNKKGTEIDGVGQTPLYSMGESMNAWAGSSQVMLSKYSSLRENFIMIPDADWIELQIIRSKAASMQSNSGGGFLSTFFQKSSSTYDAPRKPPKRLPLPSTIDPVYNSTASMVLFSITPTSKAESDAKYANTILWQAIRRSLRPRPIDVWPCWSHNSLAQFREDGYTVMYPYSMRQEARMGLTKLAKNLGQSILYEYITWSESSSHADVGGGDKIQVGGGGGSVEERAGSVRLVGKDGSAIVIPALPNGRSDVMIRRTLSTHPSSSDAGQEPAVVMRRVKDLPVEDELTMREWEGPPLEKITLK